MVTFQNNSDDAVTFLQELANGNHRYRFTLHPRRDHEEEVLSGPAVTYEKLRMVVGTDSNGEWTDKYVTNGELTGLEKVIITRRGDGTFELDKQERVTRLQGVTNYVRRLWRGERDGRRPQV